MKKKQTELRWNHEADAQAADAVNETIFESSARKNASVLFYPGGVVLEKLILVLKIAAICGAAGILGGWFSAEVKKNKREGIPVYKAYGSPPGILIGILILLLPVLAWVLKR